MDYWYIVCLFLITFGHPRAKSALAALKPEQQALVKKALAGMTKWTLFVLVVIFALAELVVYFGAATWLRRSYPGILLISAVVLMSCELYRLSRLDLPSVYLRRISAGYLGFALFMALIGYSMISGLISPAHAEYRFTKMAAAVQKSMPRADVLRIAEQIGYTEHNLTLEGGGSVNGSAAYPIEKLFDVYVYKSYEHAKLVVVRYDDQASVKEINLYQ